MKEIIQFFKTHSGYARMKDLKQAGFHTRNIRSMLDNGYIEKIKSGFYRLTDIPQTDGIPLSFIDVCKSIPKGIICLISALEYHGLSMINPSEIYVAIPNSEKPQTIEYPPVKIFYFRERFYDFGIETKKNNHEFVKIYNPEKTICDMFRYRKKLGEDLALEGLKNYLKRKDADINKLREYAKICQVKTILFPYLTAMLVK